MPIEVLALFVILVLIILFTFLLIFFRDPERFPNDIGIISPADGKVSKIVGQKVCIFMNLHDVHVNRAPLSGTVKSVKHVKGKFKPAFSKESDSNEKNIVVISTEYGDLEVTQIAGSFARRIICYVSEGQKVSRAQRIGMIRFGSRVDVTIPENFLITVNNKQKVRAGETTIAKLK